jgi:hypothetical protein
VSNADAAYNQLAFKASHNSYDRDENLHEQLLWNPLRPYDGGCRGLELDINRHSDSTGGTGLHFFQVSHIQGNTGTPLGAYLGYLLSWHLFDTGHGPVFVDLDIKSKSGDETTFPVEIDNYLREWFSVPLMVTPGNLVGQSGLELVAYVQRHGWPRLSDLAGKFIFCLSGNDKWKSFYARTAPTSRLCFADFDVDDRADSSPVTSGWRAVANVHLYSGDYGKWKNLIPKLRAQAFLVRGYVLNGYDIWQKAQTAGVNVLATDKVKDHDWAKVGIVVNEPFAPSPG